MPTHYTLRMQFGPHQDADIITDQLLKLVEEARVDEIMFFFFAEEMNDGHGPLKTLGQDWLTSVQKDWLRGIKSRLTRGIVCSTLIEGG